MLLVSGAQLYIWRKVDAVLNRFERQSISSRGFAALRKNRHYLFKNFENQTWI